MNSDMFENIKNCKAKNLYVSLWKNNSIVNDNEIVKSIVKRNKQSRCSFSFAGDNKVETLIKVFGIPKENRNLFRQKFAMVCSGCGNEYMKILTLHSSALLALLFFYNVTEENRLKIDGIGTFCKSAFEFKSPVIDKCHPSSIDVALIGENENGEKIVLLLESKFSEYYMCTEKKSCKISEKYLYNKYSTPLYSDEFLEKLGIKKICHKDGLFKLASDETFYIDGIKQMISHYVGLRNNVDIECDCMEQSEIGQDEVREAINNGARIIMAEIMFDPVIGDFETEDGRTYKAIYNEKFKILAEKMNEEIERSNLKDRIHVCPIELGYSMFLRDNLGFKLDKGVREFYFGRE